MKKSREQRESLGSSFEAELARALAKPAEGRVLTPLHIMVRARIFGVGLDLKLAKGVEPSSDRLLAERARSLAEPWRRAKLAEVWANLVKDAGKRPDVLPYVHRRLDARVPLNRSMVESAEVEIELLGRALMRKVVAIRGVAMAQVLLSDGCGPVYNPGSKFNLSELLREVVSYLDPLHVSRGPVAWLD